MVDFGLLLVGIWRDDDGGEGVGDEAGHMVMVRAL